MWLDDIILVYYGGSVPVVVCIVLLRLDLQPLCRAIHRAILRDRESRPASYENAAQICALPAFLLGVVQTFLQQCD